MQCHGQAMEEGETRYTVKKGHDRGTGIEAVLVQAPRLERAARYVKHLGRLTLGDTLGVQTIILRQQVSAFEAIPALMAILVASWRILDYYAHSDLLVPSFTFVC
jgi:hypothetical protein